MRVSDWSSDVCSSDLRIPGRSRNPRNGLGGRPGRTAAWRPAALSLSLVPAVAREEAALCADDGRARVRPRQAHLAGPAGAVACMALLARLRASRRLPRRHAGADRVLRQRQLRAPEGDHAVEIGRAHVELQSLMRISYAVFCL